jgi:hypothetical protein
MSKFIPTPTALKKDAEKRATLAEAHAAAAETLAREYANEVFELRLAKAREAAIRASQQHG